MIAKINRNVDYSIASPSANTGKFNRNTNASYTPTAGERILYGAGGLGLGLAQGVSSAVEGITDFFAGGFLQLTGQKKAAKEVYQNSWSGDFRKWIEDEFNPDDNKAFSTYLDVVSVVGNAGAQVGLAAISGGSSAALGASKAAVKVASLAPIFMSGAGSGTSEAVQTTGKLGAKENAYGLASGTLEVTMEKALGSTGKLLGKAGLFGDAEKQAVKEISKHAVLKGIASNAGSEFMEEAATEAANTYLKRITQVDPNARISKSDLIRAGVYGAIAGGVLGGTSSAFSVRSINNAGRRIITDGNERATVAEAKALVSAARKTTDRGFLDMDTVARVEKALELYDSDKNAPESRRAYYLGQMSAGLLTVGTYASAHQYAVRAADTVAQGGDAAKALIDGANAMFEENLGRKLTAEDFKDAKSLGSRMLASVSVYDSLLTPTDAELIDSKIREDSAVAYNEAALRADAEQMSAGNGTALYRLSDGNYAVVTRRGGDGAFSVGLMKKGEGTQVFAPVHGLKTVDNVVEAIGKLKSGTATVTPSVATPKAPTAPETKAEPKKPEAPASSDSVAQKKGTVKKKEQKNTKDHAKSTEKVPKESKMEQSERIARSPSSNESIAEEFRRKIDTWDGHTIGFSFTVGITADDIANIEVNGKKIGNRQIRIDASKIKKTLSDHPDMNLETIKQLPKMIASPIVVMESKTVKGRIVMFGEVYDAKKRPIMVALELNPTSSSGKATLNFIKIATAQGRKNVQNLLNTSKILLWNENKNRVNDWLKVNRLQLPLLNSQSDSAIKSIAHSAEKVNPKSEKNSAKSENATKTVENETDASVEDRLRIRIYDKATFDAKEISAARADYKLFDALPDEQRKAILIMRRSAAEAKISDVKVKGLTRMMGAFGFRAVFSPQINSNGFWVHGKNLTVINPNEIYQSTFGHELAHRVEDYAGYDEFAAKVEKLVGKKAMEAAKAQYLADYNAAAEVYGWEKWDAEKNADDLKREAVASMVGKYLANANYVEKLANADRGFLYRAYRAIARMRADIAVANKIASESELSTFSEYRTVRRMEKVFETALTVSEGQKNGSVNSSMSRYAKPSKTNPAYLDPRTVTKEDVIELLKKANDPATSAKTYIPLRISTPPTLIYWAKKKLNDIIEDCPIGMSVDKVRQALDRKGENESGRPHHLSVNDMVKIVETMNTPRYIVYQTSNNRYVEVINYITENKKRAFAVLEIGESKDAPYMNGYEGGKYNILVTTYPPDDGKLQELLKNKGNIVVYDSEKDASQRTSSSTVLSVLNDTPFYNDSISETAEKINPSDEISSEKVSKSVAPNTNAVESRILFGTPAGQQSAKERVKGAMDSVVDLLTKKESRHEFWESMREGMDTFSIYFSNSFAAVETQLRRMAKDGEWDGSYSRMTRQRAQAWAQYVRTAEAKALGMLTMGQFKADGTAYENGGEALLQIIEPVLATKGETFEAVDESGNIVTVKAKGGELGGAKYRRISGYLTALNALERAAQGKNPFDSISEAELQGIVAEYEKSNPEFKEIAAKWSQFNKNLLQYRVDTGLMSQETADQLHAMYPHYIPMYKPSIELLKGTAPVRGKSSLEVNNNVKRAKGGDHLVDDPIANYCNTIVQTVKAAHANMLMNELYLTADGKHIITDTALAEIGEEVNQTAEGYIEDPDSNPDAVSVLTALTTKAADGLTNTLYFYKDGERCAMKVSKDIFLGLQSMNKSDFSCRGAWMLNGMAAINSGYKRLITSLNPFFSPKNVVRDLADGLLHSRFKMRQFIGAYIRMGRLMASGKLAEDSRWKEFVANGGLQSALFDRNDSRLAKRSRRTGLQSGEGLVGSSFQTIENANTLLEALPRFAEYVLSRENGMDIMDSINNSAEVTTNFARSGIAGGFLNKTIMPFLNPSIQGFSKPIRNVIENASAKSMLALLIRAALLGVVPMVLNNLLYNDDDDYTDLDDSVKENNFLFKVGDQFIKIPRGRVVSVISGAYNRTAKQVTGQYVDWKDYLENVKSQATPMDSITRTIFSPFKDVSTNTTWYGGKIENEGMQNLAPEDRYDEYTSSLAIALGKVTGKAFDVSPKKVHYLLDQYSGILGDIILPMTTTGTKTTLVGSNFTADPNTNSNLSDRFYAAYNNAMYAKNKGDEAALYEYKRLSETKQLASNMYKQISDINKRTDLSKAEKREQSAILRATINQLYKTALKDRNAYTSAVEAALPIAKLYTVEEITDKNRKALGAEKDDVGKYAVVYDGETKVSVFDSKDAAGEYISSATQKTVYAEANRLVYGAEYALKEYNSSLYEKSNTIARLGISADDYYNFYMTARYWSGSDKKKKIEKYCKENGFSKSETAILMYYSGYSSYRDEVVSIAKKSGFTNSEIKNI